MTNSSIVRSLAAWVAVPALLLPFETPSAARQGPAPEIREWVVPYESSRPRDPYLDSQGRVWFVGQRTHYLAYLDPATGEFTKYDLDDASGPHTVIVDGFDRVWYTGNLRGYIGRLDPATGEVTKYEMPDPAARDPHSMALDSRGDIWFTAQRSNFVGRLETATGRVQLIPVETRSALPYGVKVDATDRPWFVLFGTNKIATVDPATMSLEEIELPRADARARRFELDSQGNVWYADYAKGRVVMYDPVAKTFDEWATPGGESSQPYGTAMDASDRFWFVESGTRPNRFVGFDTRTKQFVGSAEIPSGGGTVRHMYYHEPTNEVWFGTDTNNIGRAALPARES